MDFNLIGSGVINSIKPYCRKHVINSLDECEFALLNTVIIGIILFGYTIYSNKSVGDIGHKYCNLSSTQMISIVTLSAITVIGTLLKLSFDKKNSPTFTNGIIVKGITSAIVIFIGILFYNEMYTWKTWIGILSISGGLYLIT